MAVLSATLRPASVSVDAGAEATCILTVENTSTVMQRVGVAVGGEAASWTALDPAKVSVLSGQRREVTVRFRPPRGPVPRAGPVAVQVTVTARDAPDETIATEAVVTVNPFVATTATITPKVSHGLRRARHVLRVNNSGNTPVAVEVSAEDSDRLLEVDVQPSTLALDPGSEGKARIGVRVIPGWPTGDDRSRSFRATVRAGDGPPVTVEAAMHIRAVRLGFVVPALGAVAALVVAGLLLVNGKGGSAVGSQPKRTVPAGSAGTTSPGPGGRTTNPARTTTPAPTTAPAAATAAGPAAAIASGAQCRTTADLKVSGPELRNADGTFVRRFGDDNTALAARDLLSLKPMFCTIGKAGDDDAELTFPPPPLGPTPPVPGSKCTSRYVPERLATSQSQDTFVVEVDPNRRLFYSKEADRDRALALLKGYSQICWLGGGSDDIFSLVFDWKSAVTYF